MGFCGIGTQGGGHLFGGAWTYLPGGYLARRDVQVLGVCDVQHRRADDAKIRVEQFYAKQSGKGSYQSCRAYYDIRDMLLNDDIDAVLIACSYWGQGVMASLAVRAGKDVYCEKPTSIAIRWGRAMVESVRANDRIFQAGTQQRSEYDGRFYRAVSLVRGGAIGKLQRVYAYQGGGGFAFPDPGLHPDNKAPADVSWEAYVGPAPWFDYDGSTGAHASAGAIPTGASTTTTSCSGDSAPTTPAPSKFASRTAKSFIAMPAAWKSMAANRRAIRGIRAARASSAARARSPFIATCWSPIRRKSLRRHPPRQCRAFTTAPATVATSWNASALDSGQ